jgi:hypothetical protein
MPTADFDAAFIALKSIFAPSLKHLQVTVDKPDNYTLSTLKASPMPQHKGAPMFFAQVRRGKAYVSLHLFPLYVHAELAASVPPELKKRMQGLTCFNFKAAPDATQTSELKRLIRDSLKAFQKTGWA